LIAHRQAGALQPSDGRCNMFGLHVFLWVVLESDNKDPRVASTRVQDQVVQIAEILAVGRQHSEDGTDGVVQVAGVRPAG